MNRHYECLLRSIVYEPAKRVSELEMRTTAEIRAEAESRKARVEKNASRLRNTRRTTVADLQPLAQTPNLSKPFATDER